MEHVAMEYSEITAFITIGTNMCCSMHGARLTELGYEADIDLEEERQEVPPRVPIYLWLPTADHTAPTFEQLEVGISCLAQLVALEKKVYVHCQHGHGRAPALVAAYFISTGKSVEEATAIIQTKRPETHIRTNQLEALKEFQRRHG